MTNSQEITTPDDFYNEMSRISRDISKENPVFAYQLAVTTMCNLLSRLGFFDGVAVFDEMDSRSSVFVSDD